MQCRVCSEPLEYRFALPVLAGRHRAEYYRCTACDCLQVPSPTWLAEAYADPSAAVRADGGRFRRTFSAFLYLTALLRARALPSRPKLLDFGGGYGLLAQMLANADLDAFTHDPHEAHRLFAVDRWIDDLRSRPDHSFDVVTALEVFEHLTDPLVTARELRRLLKPAGTFVLSTGIYDPAGHDESWPYLAPETGQHVTLYSRPALRQLARAMGFRTVAHFPGDQGILILLSPLPADELEPALARAHQLLRDERHAHHATRSWDLRTGGWVPETVAPALEEIAT